MDKHNLKKAGSRRALTTEIAMRTNDPDFFGALHFLPNPDPILRKLGKSQEVYDAIIMDTHVIGDMRSIRAGIQSFEHKLLPGGDAPADMAAFELCTKVLDRPPHRGYHWTDTLWNIGQFAFRGFSVHEVIWGREDQFLLPVKIKDEPQRRFVFGVENDLRLRTKSHPIKGIELGERRWLLARHMPSRDNPYGVALLSSCFWPYTFKHSGWRYFVKLAEKYGIPWAIGRYPLGTGKDEQDDLAEKLAIMIESAVAAVPEGTGIELLEASSTSGDVVQERIIRLANSEMSKALTSQTLSSEIQGDGSRAATETHRGKEKDVQASDRIVIRQTMNELLRWITEVNVPGAVSPQFVFYEEDAPSLGWIEAIDKVRGIIEIPAQFARDRMKIPAPKSGEEVLQSGASDSANSTGNAAPDFSACPNCGKTHDYATGDEEDDISRLTKQAAELADTVIGDDFLAPARVLLDSVFTAGGSLSDFRDQLEALYPELSTTALEDMSKGAVMVGALSGINEVK